MYSIYTLYTECIAGIEMARLILDVYECTLSVCSVCILQQHIDGRAYTGCILSVYYSGHIGGCGCGCIQHTPLIRRRHKLGLTTFNNSITIYINVYYNILYHNIYITTKLT